MNKGKPSKSRKRASPIDKQRNRVRGLIAASKSSHVAIGLDQRGKDGFSKRAASFQHSLASILAQSRQAIGSSQFADFLTWLEQQTSHQVQIFKQIRALDSSILKDVLDASPLPLAKELQWIAARLSQHTTTLSAYVAAASLLEEAFWNGDWQDIKSHLTLIETQFGRSLWLTEAKISLIQEFEGLESQKKVAAEERKYGKRSLLAYFAYNVSVRNEPTTVIARYFDDLHPRIDRLKVSDGLKDFLKFKLIDNFELSEQSASNVLNISQGLSEIDLYESFIQVCQGLISTHIDRDLQGVIGDSLALLTGIGDPRVKGLMESAEPKSRVSKKVEWPTTVRACIQLLQLNSRCASASIICASLISNVRNIKDFDLQGPRWPLLIRKMSQAMRYEQSYDADVDAVKKYLGNHRIFAAAQSCWELFQAEMTVDALLARKHRTQALLLGSQDFCWDDAGTSLLDKNQSALGLSDSRPWIAVRAQLQGLQEAISARKIDFLLREITHLYLSKALPLSVLPVRDAFESLRWRDVKQWRGLLALPICLQLNWRVADNDAAASLLRQSYDQFLESNGVTHASELAAIGDRFDRNELVYFLNSVSVQAVIDMSQWLKSSRAVEQERIEICSSLLAIDPENADIYNDEILRITNLLGVQDGKTIVDSSRVHVDTNAIESWAKRELAPVFARYRDLVEAGVGLAEDLPTIIRAFSTANATAYLEVPESEADTVLVDLMSALLDKFLLDPQHSLDSYLSRRVRHHSMIGYLRGPVEEESLITARTGKDRRYARNSAWLDRLGIQDPLQKHGVARAFESFAEEFDGFVLRLKDELFHVKSEDHPKGIFDISLSPQLIHLVRSAVQSSMSLEQLCQIAFTMFWIMLDSSLSVARTTLQVDTKHSFSLTFQRLRAALKKLLQPDKYEDVLLSINKAAENVQREIDKMSNWFVKREAEQATQIYPIAKALDIAIDSALNSHRPFKPIIVPRVNTEINVRTGDLVVVAEIVLTVLGNVRQYASTSGHPRVEITIDSNEIDRVTFKFVNEVGINQRTPSTLMRLDKIRSQIADGSYIESVRREGGTGLKKIANLVGPAQLSAFSFGFADERHFQVEASFSYIDQSAEGGIKIGRLIS